MKRTIFVLILGLSTLALLAACGGEEPAATTAPTEAPAATETASEPVSGTAAVDSIEVLIMESFPVQVNVRARGDLPDGCTTIDDVSSEQVGNTFNVTITTLRQPDQVCTEALVPFEEMIPLDVVGLPAGTYTVNVNEIEGSFTLEVDNVAGAEPTAEPTATSAPEDSNMALINGRVWHDLCAVAGGEGDEAPAPSAGCIAVEGEETTFQANGLLEDGEPGIEGVTVSLGEGACPSTGLETAVTDEDGDYVFSELPAGEYCVSIDAAGETNAGLLETGTWTAPESGDAAATVTVGDGEVVTGINFGWDFEFLPVPEVDLENCTNSIEFVEDLSVPDDTVFAPGQEFEKGWRLRNNGTCPWTTDYSLVFVNGDDMSEEDAVPLEETVVPGQTYDAFVTFTAPEEFGTYRSNWQIANADGQPFGVGGLIEEAFWVQIEVGEAPATPAPNSAAIGGVVWEDICVLNADGDPVRGCVEIGDSGVYRADGTLNFNEPRLVGITVSLIEGACSEDGTVDPGTVAQTAVTDEEGLYRFTNLAEGTYCVAIDALSDANVDLLIPGDWTWPAPGVGRYGLVLNPGEELLETDFGWEYR